jgi:Lysozyme like domain
MGDDQVSGVAVGSVAFGALLVFAGIKGYSIPQTLQLVIQGKSPLGQAQVTPVTQASAAAGTAGAAGVPGVSSSALPSAGSYSSAQIESLWVLAGGSQGAARNAACHAMQESGGQPRITSANPDGGTNVGLWQLDTPGGKGAGYSVAELQNAMNNARVTVSATRNGADWSAWATPGC